MKIAKEEGDGSFFRVLLPGFSKKLPIPVAFVEHVIMKENCNTRAAVIANPNGESWHVSVYKEKMQEVMYFGGNGWLELINANNLGLGYFLVFTYRGNMKFIFRAYDLSACEVTSYYSSTLHEKDHVTKDKKKKIEKKNKVIEANREDQDLIVKGDVSHGWPTKHSDYEKRMDQHDDELECKLNEWIRTWKRKTYRRTEGANFKFTLSAHSYKRCFVNIPVRFSNTHDLTKHSELTLSDPKGRVWHVGLWHRRIRAGRAKDTIHITAGWREFVFGNNLKVGDECIFELVPQEGENKVMSVKILRAAACCHE